MNKILCIVDDQDDYPLLIQQLAKSFPTCRVHVFNSGIALLDQLSELNPKPSLLLIDLHMPDLNGYQTLQVLKEHSGLKTIPVVMMSAEASGVEINRCYEAGANAFLVKQADLQEMKKRLEVVIAYWLDTNQTAMPHADEGG